MSIIGGTIQPKKGKSHTHRIVIQNAKGERTTFNFYTLRSARNWLRERGSNNVVELMNTTTNTRLPIIVHA